MALGINKKDKPLTEDKGWKSIYLLDDQMFRFWYRFIPNNMSSIATGLSNIVQLRYKKLFIDIIYRLCYQLIAVKLNCISIFMVDIIP